MNAPSDHNPYQPPTADVTPPAERLQEEFIPGGRSVPAGNALAWIGKGWAFFGRSPGIWIANTIIMFLLFIVLSVIPIIGGFATNLLMPIVIGGILLGCGSLDEGGGLRVEHLFAGFKDKGGQLALIGLFMLVATIVIFIVIFVLALAMFGGSILQAAGNQQALAELFVARGLLMIALVVLFAMALTIPLWMAFWFAPALVVFHDLDAVDAMKQSFQGCLRNILPFLLYGVIFLLLGIVAVIPLGLGLLVIVPVAYGSLYASYKDIFLRRAED